MKINKTPHPIAARVFLNWLLTREGQTIYSKNMLNQSARVDVTTEHLDPLEVRLDINYIPGDSEGFILADVEWLQIARELFPRNPPCPLARGHHEG